MDAAPISSVTGSARQDGRSTMRDEERNNKAHQCGKGLGEGGETQRP